MVPKDANWRVRFNSAIEEVKGRADDPKIQAAVGATSRAVSAGSRKVDVARRRVTQEESWAEVTAAIEELVAVVTMQQQQIVDLTEAVAQLNTSHERP